MSEFTIIKGTVPPTSCPGYKYPFADMVVGDAFDAPETKRPLISSAAVSDTKRSGRRWTIRKIGNDTIRVWRVA